jgi:hypothetical protein
LRQFRGEIITIQGLNTSFGRLAEVLFQRLPITSLSQNMLNYY